MAGGTLGHTPKYTSTFTSEYFHTAFLATMTERYFVASYPETVLLHIIWQYIPQQQEKEG